MKPLHNRHYSWFVMDMTIFVSAIESGKTVLKYSKTCQCCSHWCLLHTCSMLEGQFEVFSNHIWLCQMFSERSFML